MGFWNFIEVGRSRSWAFGILQKLGEVEVGELRLTLKPTPELAFLFPNPGCKEGPDDHTIETWEIVESGAENRHRARRHNDLRCRALK